MTLRIDQLSAPSYSTFSQNCSKLSKVASRALLTTVLTLTGREAREATRDYTTLYYTTLYTLPVLHLPGYTTVFLPPSACTTRSAVAP